MAANTDIQNQILNSISNANQTVDIAVSWFTDRKILNELIKRTSQGINARVLVSADEVNLFRWREFEKLQKHGALVKKWGEEDATNGNFMHAKMMIIDNEISYVGSYNFTENALSNFERFSKESYSELMNSISKFRNWFNQGVDVFFNIEDPVKIESKLKSRLKEKINRSNLFANQIAKELTERERIIQHEIEVQKMQEQRKSLAEGSTGIDKTGSISSSAITSKVKPHKFYGGKLKTTFFKQKEKSGYQKANLQKYWLDRTFNNFKSIIENGTLISNGIISLNEEDYRVKIEFRSGYQPQVYILNKSIECHPDIHMYSNNSLCLFYPNEFKWRPNTSIAETIVPWIYDWILNYQIFQKTGIWEGESQPHGIINEFDKELNKFEGSPR